jgi:voltage-gated potassium channel
MLIPAMLVAAGTVGYQLIEGWSFLDSLYMTVITLTTVGYREVRELSVVGMYFTMLVCMGGVFTLFYVATGMIGSVVGGELQAILGSQRMERSLSTMKDHLIVCGFGRMGKLVCTEFSANGLPFVIVDRNQESLDGFHIPQGIALHGDATSDEVLERAGIKRARAIVTVAASDVDNLYITMSARLLNEKIFIVARAEDDRSEQKLIRAGANRVVSPYQIGGSRVAQAILRPTVVDFLELATRSEHMELNIEETRIDTKSSLVGMTLSSSKIRQEHGLIVVAIKKSSGKMVFNPPHDTVLEPNDILIMLGGRSDVDRLAARAAG